MPVRVPVNHLFGNCLALHGHASVEMATAHMDTAHGLLAICGWSLTKQGRAITGGMCCVLSPPFFAKGLPGGGRGLLKKRRKHGGGGSRGTVP
jgi:hypothetical protein